MEGRPYSRYPKKVKTLPCLHCQRKFHTQNALKQHVRALHPDIDMPQIDLSVPMSSTLVTTPSEHNTLKVSRMIVCPACPRHFATQPAFAQHVKAIHRVPAQVGRGKGAASMTTSTPRAPDLRDEPEELQPLLERLTISPTFTSPLQVQTDVFAPAACLKEDFIDDGWSYAVRHHSQPVKWAFFTLPASLPTLHSLSYLQLTLCTEASPSWNWQSSPSGGTADQIPIYGSDSGRHRANI